VIVAAPIFLVWAGALALVFLDGRRRLVGWAGAGVLAAAIAAAVRLALRVRGEGALTLTTGGWPAGIGITLRADALGLTFVLVSLVVLAAALLYQLAAGRPARRFPGLVLFMATGLSGMFLTADAFNFYVFFEVAMASAFAMTTEARSAREVRAALLFVVLNVLGSALFLMAIGGLYHITGTLDMAAAGAMLAGTEAPNAAGIGALMLAAFSLKLGLFPFHVWLPDVYRDLRPEVAAVFSGALANIGSYGLLRFGGEVMPGALRDAGALLVALGAASILYGALMAAAARSVNSVLAYSSIGQAGYVLVAVALSTPAGFGAALVYAIVVPLNKAALFLSAGLRTATARAAFGAAALSMAGVPPFAGFSAKLLLLESGADASAWLALAVIVVGSALTFLYMFSAFQRTYWAAGTRGRTPVVAGAVLAVLVIALAVGGAWPAGLVALGEQGSAALERAR
jgi:multicomponent Na+:H+ antiporter subunit D